MPQPDGTVFIDSLMSSKGFNKGVKAMEKGLAPLTKAVAALFITLLGVKAIKAVASLAAEFQRLEFAAQAVGQIQGMAADETRRLTQEIIDSGIQTDIANRAYVNFARNGLDLALLPALARGAQDLNVFSAAGETSSDVLERITFGVLNLNALMLRRAGIAVDILAAEKAYGKTIGKTTQQMTVQEKRQGVLIKVLEEMKTVQGLYELSQKTVAGQLASNVRIMNEFKAVLGGPLQNAFFTLIKSWNSLLKVMTASLGPGGAMRDTFIQIGAAASVLADIIASLFRAIAALFGGGGTGGKGSKLGKSGTSAFGTLADDSLAAAAGQDALGDAVDGAGEKAKGALAPFDELNVLQKDEGAGAGADGIGDLGALGGIDASKFVNPMDEVAAAAEDMKKRIWASLSDVIKKFLEISAWAEKNKGMILTIIILLGIAAVSLAALGFAGWVVIAIIGGLIFIIFNLAKAWEIMGQIAFLAWFGIQNAAKWAWEKIKETWDKVMHWFQENVFIPLGVGFRSLKEDIKNALVGAFESAKNIIKGIINGIIYFMNQMIAGVINGINGIIFAANTVSSLAGVPAMGYVSASYIPYLAKGAVIQPNAPFAAVLGDQKSGKNIEAPENLIRQIVREEMQGSGGEEMTINMPVYLDSEKIYEGQKKVKTRRGPSLISGGSLA